MQLFLYNVILNIIDGPARYWLRKHPVYAPLVARFSPDVPQSSQSPIWVQVCSLGEANAALPLIEATREAFPDQCVVISSSTLTGYAQCKTLYGEENVTWFPFDTRDAVREFISNLNPQVLILFETELWPNVLAECQASSVPILLANGRLSDKNLQRYRRYRWWYGPLVSRIDAACMQEALFAQRLTALGVPENRITTTGSMKFDVARDTLSARERSSIRKSWGFQDDDVILLFASTRPGDENLASACWATLRDESPRYKIVIAPRHLDRIDEVMEPITEASIRRTAMANDQVQHGERVFILDTMGELSSFFAVSNVTVIGGSFYPGVNGHNPLEAAAFGVPTVFGRYMSNFSQAEKVLLDAGGAQQVACPEDLYLALSNLLSDHGKQRQMGTAARRAVLANRGAVAKTVECLEELLSRHGTL